MTSDLRTVDLLGWIDAALRDARESAAAAVDQAQAFAELRSMALELAQRVESTYLTVDGAEAALATEEERARWRALCLRATNPPEETHRAAA